MNARPLDDGLGRILNLQELVLRRVDGIAEDDGRLPPLFRREVVDAVGELRELVDRGPLDIGQHGRWRLGGLHDAHTEAALLRRLGGKERKDGDLQKEKDSDERDSLHRDVANNCLRSRNCRVLPARV